jgi:parallel beta-helix repeat protein
MSKKPVLTAILMAVLVGMLSLSFKAHNVEASGTIYIRADGSIDPPTVPISTTDNVTYTFTGNIYDSIVVERDSIIIDGAGYTVQRTGYRTGVGIELSERRNVKVTNTTIRDFDLGIKSFPSSPSSSNNSIVGNNIIDNRDGLYLDFSSNNSVAGNVFTGCGLVAYESYGNLVEDNLVNGKPLVYLEDVSNYVVEDAGQVILLNCNNIRIENFNLSNTDYAIQLGGTNNTTIRRNHITANSDYGILLYASANNNSIVGNNITNNGYGMWVETFSDNNSIVGNNIANNSHGILLGGGSHSNHIFHNNFMNNRQQTVAVDWYSQFWDDGYSSGGNYWNDYAGVDSDHDGIGDTVHVVDGNNTDRYPLMGMFSDFNATLEHHIQIVCNSSLSNFGFNGTVIVFDVAGKDNTAGFCRICIPTDLINETYRIFVNRTEVQYNTLSCSNTTHKYLYFNYAHPRETVLIINADWYKANPLMGDVNRDMKVDMKDLLTAVTSFGFRSSNPKWNPYSDVTGDGTVNIKDFATIVRHFGEHYP